MVSQVLTVLLCSHRYEQISIELAAIEPYTAGGILIL